MKKLIFCFILLSFSNLCFSGEIKKFYDKNGKYSGKSITEGYITKQYDYLNRYIGKETYDSKTKVTKFYDKNGKLIGKSK